MQQAIAPHTTPLAAVHAGRAEPPCPSRKVNRRARARLRASRKAARAADRRRLNTPPWPELMGHCQRLGVLWVREHVIAKYGVDAMSKLTSEQIAEAVGLARATRASDLSAIT